MSATGAHCSLPISSFRLSTAVVRNRVTERPLSASNECAAPRPMWLIVPNWEELIGAGPEHEDHEIRLVA